MILKENYFLSFRQTPPFKLFIAWKNKVWKKIIISFPKYAKILKNYGKSNVVICFRFEFFPLIPLMA